MSERWDEIGSHGKPDVYEESGALERECPHCGAQPDERCTFEVQELGKTIRVTRHLPCLSRLLGADSKEKP